MPKNPPKVEFTLTQKQIDAFNCPDQFLLYGGAKGGGKSWFLCVWIFTQAIQNPHSKWFFFRKRGVDFTNTTLETWKKCIPGSQYIINPNLKKITIKATKATIDYGGLDDELAVEKLNSAEYSGGAIDQAEEIQKDSFAMCRGTLRHKRVLCVEHGSECSLKCSGRNYPYQVRLSANPRQCWLKNDFILAPKKGHKFIQALPSDNTFLPETYIENMEEGYGHRQELLNAYLYGSWDEAESNNTCIRHNDIIKNKTIVPHGAVTKRIIVNDPSHFGDDENVAYVMEQQGGIVQIVHEDCTFKKDGVQTAAKLAAMRIRFEASDIFVDMTGVGTSVVDQLNELDQPVHGIHSQSRPTIETAQKKYGNLRSQMWVEAGDKFANQRCKTNDELLEGQLSSITFDFKANGIMQVEGKADIKKRLGRSPDRADAFVLGLWGLDQAGTIQEHEYIDKTVDRAGYGTPVNDESFDQLSPLAEAL